jgi:hypothetical protein
MTDRVLFPLLHKVQAECPNPTTYHGWIFFESLSMVYASVLQSYIYSDPAWQSTGQ